MFWRIYLEYYYIQPNYFRSFKCIGGECEFSCYDGWNVDWYKEEYDRLVGAQMPDELREKLESSFRKRNNGNYRIHMKIMLSENDGGALDKVFGERSRCPFHDPETGLCDIQKTLGEKYLGAVCGYYPRIIFNIKETAVRVCSCSCPAVDKLLLNDKDAVKLEKILARDWQKVPDKAVIHDPKENLIERPYLKYRLSILEFYSELFNKCDSIDDLIVLGAIAARKISDASLGGKVDEIPGIINNYRKQFDAPDVLKSVADIKGNYNIKFEIIHSLLNNPNRTKNNDPDIKVFFEEDCFVPELYEKGLELFSDHFGGEKYPLRNVIANMFYNLFMGGFPIGKTFMDTYMYFTICAAVIQMIAAVNGHKGNDIDNNFVNDVSAIMRTLTHNSVLCDDIIRIAAEKGLTSTAHFALIIK